MGRMARAVAAGLPHHVTQRGNRRMKVFFSDEDYALYLDLMSASCRELGVEVWAYCLMPNHVHLIVNPESEDGLRRAIGDAHRRYSRHVNFREKWRGHLFQGRFASFVMDEGYLLAAARYVELNPVRAGLVEKAWAWKWSSARAHRKGKDDGLVKVRPLLELAGNWEKFLGTYPGEEECQAIRKHERTGRPLGSKEFVRKVERRLGRVLLPCKPGRKAKGRSGN
jgi:putative transposase